jgi:GDP-4-dehydro-6-deoxy-D-mannose reductase
MRVLITGVNGFVGGHLVDALRADGGHTLAGLTRSADGTVPAGVERHVADLLDSPRLEGVLRDVRPEVVFHLAGYANTGKSFREPDRCWADNLTGTRSLYDAMLKTDVRPQIVFASTGLVYGDPDRGECDEQTVLKPASPYAASKAAADLLGYQMWKSAGLNIVRVRLFNQIGPRQPADYAVANFARQVAAVEQGRQTVIETGDLSAHRDLTDVRDMVSALRLLAEHGRPGEVYNAGSGRTWQIQQVLDELLQLSTRTIEVRQTIDPHRKADTAVTRANPAKLIAATGWQPRFDLRQTLTDVLDHWRAKAG